MLFFSPIRCCPSFSLILIKHTHTLKIEDLLNSNGAQPDKYLSSFITHVICDNIDHPDYLEAKEAFELTLVKVNITVREWKLTNVNFF